MMMFICVDNKLCRAAGWHSQCVCVCGIVSFFWSHYLTLFDRYGIDAPLGLHLIMWVRVGQFRDWGFVVKVIRGSRGFIR